MRGASNIIKRPRAELICEAVSIWDIVVGIPSRRTCTGTSACTNVWLERDFCYDRLSSFTRL